MSDITLHWLLNGFSHITIEIEVSHQKLNFIKEGFYSFKTGLNHVVERISHDLW